MPHRTGSTYSGVTRSEDSIAFVPDTLLERKRRSEQSGMPTEKDSNDMRLLEDQLVRTLEAAEAGVLAFVITHGGTREWHYYVAESADLGAVINAALAELPRRPIEFQIEDDAEWAELAKILSSVQSEA